MLPAGQKSSVDFPKFPASIHPPAGLQSEKLIQQISSCLIIWTFNISLLVGWMRTIDVMSRDYGNNYSKQSRWTASVLGKGDLMFLCRWKGWSVIGTFRFSIIIFNQSNQSLFKRLHSLHCKRPAQVKTSYQLDLENAGCFPKYETKLWILKVMNNGNLCDDEE